MRSLASIKASQTAPNRQSNKMESEVSTAASLSSCMAVFPSRQSGSGPLNSSRRTWWTRRETCLRPPGCSVASEPVSPRPSLQSLQWRLWKLNSLPTRGPPTLSTRGSSMGWGPSLLLRGSRVLIKAWQPQWWSKEAIRWSGLLWIFICLNSVH